MSRLTNIDDALKENTNLTTLYLRSNNTGYEGSKYIFDALRENKTLTILDLGWNHIEEKGAKYISGLSRLTNIDNAIKEYKT